MRSLKTISRSLVTACAALMLFAPGAALAQTQAAATAQSVGAGSAQSRDVSVAATPTVGRQGLEHRLVLYNTHTAERIDIVYRRGNEYLPAALAKLDYFLRDHVTGDVRHFDPHLYDILSDLTAAVGHPGGEIEIVCGYRTPTTNESLRAHTTGVAKHSLHIQAEAIDLRMPGINTLKLRATAVALRRGGVGYYPHSDFIHVDTGRVRQWCFECPADLMSGD
ncbi:MAG: DUF882 domain-containing protein [Candidatus Acidiferrales bacterium]